MRYLLLFAPFVLFAQPQAHVYVTAAPSGACTARAVPQIRLSTGAIYTCAGGTWSVTGTVSPTGTVTNVTGTANEATITNPTTTPNVHVIGVNNVQITGVPTSGQAPVATSATTASWQTVSATGALPIGTARCVQVYATATTLGSGCDGTKTRIGNVDLGFGVTGLILLIDSAATSPSEFATQQWQDYSITLASNETGAHTAFSGSIDLNGPVNYAAGGAGYVFNTNVNITGTLGASTAPRSTIAGITNILNTTSGGYTAGLYGEIDMSNSAGLINQGDGVAGQVTGVGLSGGTVTNASMFHALAPVNTNTNATNLYGLRVDDLTQGTNNYAIKTGLGKVQLGDNTEAPRYSTTTNCADSAGAAACGSAAAGAFVIDAGSTSTVVSTTAVTANSEIHVQFDSSLGTRLSITCNTAPATVAVPSITARTAGTSFTVSITGTVAVNPACFTYDIIN